VGRDHDGTSSGGWIAACLRQRRPGLMKGWDRERGDMKGKCETEGMPFQLCMRRSAFAGVDKTYWKLSTI
jgi:hypothetical protein